MGLGETEVIDTSFLDSADKKDPILFFPVAAFDSVDYTNLVTEKFKLISNVNVIGVPSTTENTLAKKRIEEAGGIYLGGGLTENLVNYFKKNNLVEVLQKKINSGMPVAGMSAGALALAEWYIHEDRGGQFEIREGWGILPNTCVYVHAETSKIREVVKLIKENKYTKNCKIYGIQDKAALLVKEGDKLTKIGNAQVWVV